jgi:hypothetical protein
MHFQWGFPLLQIVVGQPDWVSQVNLAFSGVIVFFAALLCLAGLIGGAVQGYDKGDARISFGFLGVAVLFWTIGFLPILFVASAAAVVWNIGWRFIIRWFLWRVFAKNAWYATFGTPPPK